MESNTLVIAAAETVKKDLEAKQSTPVSPEITAKVEDMLTSISAIGMRDLSEQRNLENQVSTLGQATVAELAQHSKLLKTPLHTLVDNAQNGGGTAASLLNLQEQVNKVNPNRMDFTMGTFRRLLSGLPFVGTPVARWFGQYQTAESVIKDIVKTLRDGESQLKRDNVTLEEDQIRYRELTFRLADYISLGQLLDARLQAHSESPDIEEDKRNFLQEKVIFPLRQRIMDLQQTMAVNQQAVVTSEVIIQNNKELIRGVNRAINVTVTALETASVMSIALQHQKKLLDATTAVNDTTNDLIVQTSEQLRTQGVEIQKQASSSQLDISKLQQAFSNIDAALSDISTHRQQVLPQMAQSILEMDNLTEKLENRILEMEKGKSAEKDFERIITL